MRHSDYFDRLHPWIPALYYITVFAVTAFCMHPFVLAVSFLSPVVYGIWLRGSKVVKQIFYGYLPFGVLAAAFNVLFNHRGETILCYLNDNPLTLESIIYGIVLAMILIDVVLWFGCFQRIMTSDKLMCMTGKLLPILSLLISMSLRFVPRYKVQMKKIIYAQKAIGRDIGKGNLIHRFLIAISCVYMLIQWALENSIETAASMKSRGFGAGRRTSFTPYHFSRRDETVLLILIALGTGLLVGASDMKVRYSPYIEIPPVSIGTIVFLVCYLGFCNLPMIYNLTKERHRC